MMACFFQAEDGIRVWSVTGVQTCALHGDKERGVRAENAAALSADELERVRVLLLRHEAGAAGYAVAQFHPSVLLARVQNPVFGEAAQVKCNQRGRMEIIERPVAVRGNIHRV